MKALRALVSRGMSALTSLLSTRTGLAEIHVPHKTDRNVKCECWACSRTKASRRGAFMRARRYSKMFGPPKLTGLRLKRVTEACAEHHLTVLPRYSRASIGAVPPIEGAPTAKQMADMFGLDIGGPTCIAG